MIAGVCQGLADHLGVAALTVRVGFLVLAVASGAGVAMYAALWVFAPQAQEAPDPGAPRRRPAPRPVGYIVATGALAISVYAVLRIAGVGAGFGTVWPVVVAGAGVVILWTQADDAQRARWRAVSGVSRATGVLRLAAGVLFTVAGGAAFLTRGSGIGQSGEVAFATLVVVAGIALISGPWWVGMAQELRVERVARVREQERAEIAAHVHDSVLHTLALIQRRVDDPREVSRLVRAQERELRGWLYRPADTAGVEGLRSGLERVAAEVEDAHGITVDLVTVGDHDLDERGRSLLLAVREALVNAAKYAAPAPVSIYAEAEPDRLVVFVRDRGPGFDLASVPADRLGVRQSILGRLARAGGQARVSRAVGGGTEVVLELPLDRPAAAGPGDPR